jgi:hypothetical protein
VTRPTEDAVVRAARRESKLALGLWLVAMTYSIAYCYRFGYERPVDTLTFVLWFPDWVFWGIIAPWLVCTIASIVFAFTVMGDEPLGDEIIDDRQALDEGHHA